MDRLPLVCFISPSIRHLWRFRRGAGRGEGKKRKKFINTCRFLCRKENPNKTAHLETKPYSTACITAIYASSTNYTISMDVKGSKQWIIFHGGDVIYACTVEFLLTFFPSIRRRAWVPAYACIRLYNGASLRIKVKIYPSEIREVPWLVEFWSGRYEIFIWKNLDSVRSNSCLFAKTKKLSKASILITYPAPNLLSFPDPFSLSLRIAIFTFVFYFSDLPNSYSLGGA